MSFSNDKRNFLHEKLDEILRLWFRNAGQGYFNLVVNDGEPEFQYGVHLDMCDGLQPEHHHQPPLPRQPPHPGHDGARRRGPGRQARNRLRAAAHQAAKAAALAANPAKATAVPAAAPTTVAAPANIFPGEGQKLGTAANPTIPLPLQKGASFPSFPAPAVCSTLPIPTVSSLSSVSSSMTSSTTLTTTVSQAPRTSVVAPIICRDELVKESDDDEEIEEQFTFCGQCLKSFDSDPMLGCCPRCMKAYHRSCSSGHTCMSYI